MRSKNLYGKVPYVDSYHMDTVRVGQRLVCVYKHVFFPAKIAERNARKVVLVHAPITAGFSDNELKTSTFITDFAFVDLFFHQHGTKISATQMSADGLKSQAL